MSTLHTLKLDELQPFHTYRDVLSGLLMQFYRIEEHEGVRLGICWYYNPVTGQHQRTTAADHQLEPLAYSWPN